MVPLEAGFSMAFRPISVERGITGGQLPEIAMPTRTSGADGRNRGTEWSDIGCGNSDRRRSFQRDRSLESIAHNASKVQREGRCCKWGK